MEEENITPNSNPQNSSNPLALAGFIVSLCSLIINLGGIVGLVGTILSAVGLSKVKTPGKYKGLAIAGLVIGIISIVYGIFSIINAVAIFSNL